MALEIRIDDPEDLEIKRPVCTLKGWCAAESSEELQGLEFRIAGLRMPWRQMARPDVEEARPAKAVKGFLVHLDLSYYLPAVRKQEFIMEAITAGASFEVHFRASREAVRKCLEAAAGP